MALYSENATLNTSEKCDWSECTVKNNTEPSWTKNEPNSTLELQPHMLNTECQLLQKKCLKLLERWEIENYLDRIAHNPELKSMDQRSLPLGY